MLTQEVLKELHMRLQLFLSSLTFTMKGSRRPEHFAALAEDPALTKRLEIEGINSDLPLACSIS